MLKSAAAADLLQTVVPSAKGIAWIVAASVTTFMAGVGATLRTSDYAELPQEMDEVQHQVTTNSSTLEDLQRDVEDTKEGLDRIRCLASLSATGQVVDPLEIDRVCP